MTRIYFSAALVASLLLACGNGNGPGDGGTGGGTTGGGTTGGTGGCAAVTPHLAPDAGYCNGAQAQTTACANVYLATYPESDDIRTNCAPTFDGLRTVGTSVAAPAGILDVNSYSTPSGLLTIYPAGCDDLGQAAAPVIQPTTITPPTGATTIATARTSMAGASIYGIVTYVNAPYYNPTTMATSLGTLYLQDQPTGTTPAPLSGISVFIDDTNATDAGTTVGYPSAGIIRGDVVALTGLTWDPYKGQDQLAWTPNTTATILGTQPLPPAISLSSADIAGTKGAQYTGMRVTQSDGPDKVVDGCPSNLYSP